MRPKVAAVLGDAVERRRDGNLALAAEHRKLYGRTGLALQEFDPLRPAFDRLPVAADDAVAGPESGPLGRRVLDDRTDDGRRARA